MKKCLGIVLIGLLFSVPVYAHHPTEDILDAEIYAVIDEMVSDTPHADLVFDDDMGGDDTTTTTITGTLRSAEELVDDGLITEVSELSGDVYITIEFEENGNDVVISIIQVPE
ncbi:MAG: hypothetical protein ACI8ZB_001275 [Desulforhopalus sp.]|jgi:hypothetical protein